MSLELDSVSLSLKPDLSIIMQHCSSSMEEHILQLNLSLLPSLPTSSFSAEIEEKRKSVFGNESDEGYHTPTSPRHQIPLVTECPSAPKKMKMRKKRKVENRDRWCRRRVEDDEFDELLNRPKKKAKKEDEENETANP